MIQQEWSEKFNQRFFHKCCELICEFKPYKNPFTDNKNEDQITHIYEKNIDSFLRSAKGQKKLLFVYKGGAFPQPKDPKNEAITDLVFRTSIGLRGETVFECKILGDNTRYIGEDGIIRFTSEKYGIEKMPFYGMLGYVKDDLANNKYKKLIKSIENKKKEMNLINQNIKKNSKNEVIFKTEHKTDKGISNNEIYITHILHSWE